MIVRSQLGRTGHDSTRIIFGSWALSKATQTEANRIPHMLLEYGVNHIGTAPMYGNAEKCIGSWMEQHRNDFFFATKSRKRTYKGAWEDLQRSLSRLRIDYLDLWRARKNPKSQPDGSTGQNSSLASRKGFTGDFFLEY